MDYSHSGEGGANIVEQGVVGRELLRKNNSRELGGSSTESVWGGSTTESWSPQTLSRRADTLADGLQEVREQLTMAKKEELSMGDLMKLMMEMNNREKEEARRREVEREERAIEREEERRREDDRREDRRIEREEREKQIAADREVQLLATLRAVQPAVPQTIHLDNTKLPRMEPGEDIQVFLELFESALVAGNVPHDKWLAKLHSALNTETKLAVKETITNPAADYQEVKTALIGQTHLTFTAASESLMTLDNGKITKVPIRQAVQKVANILEKITAEATTLREGALYSAVAVLRFALGREVKQYTDIKGAFEWNEFSRTVEEWQRTNPDRSVWDSKYRQGSEKMMYKEKQGYKPFGQTKKQGECFACGKYGHFANECRSKPRDRQTDSPFTPAAPTVKKEQVTDRVTPQRSMTDVTCFKCHQRGHISTNCTTRKNKIKKVKVQEDRLETLRTNEVFGAIGPHRMPITLDTGAEITVVPEETVAEDQFTGETKVLKAFNNTESSGKVCIVTITLDEYSFQKEAVTQPGSSLGWSACLSLNLAEEKERDILLQQIARRTAMSESDTRYLPPQVREGILVSGVPIQEAKVVKKIEERVSHTSESEQVQPDTSGAQVTKEVEKEEKEMEVLEEEVVELNRDERELSLVIEEVEGSSQEGSAESEGELPVNSIREGMPIQAMAEQTATDESLQTVRKLAELQKEGFFMSQGLIWRNRLDDFGKPTEQLCVPTTYRDRCLKAAHGQFGHQGRNKMVQLLRPFFYWLNLSRSCRDHVKQCTRCQTADKTTPRPNIMIPRTIVTQPFKDMAIDLVGPFPTATGGFKHMITCVDTATRWPEAIPLRTTTSRAIIMTLTQVFSRTGFPEKLTSDNGPQFSSKEFTAWLQKHGITHSRSTPYHPQGNGVVERLHRTLNRIILKTIQSKGNWARVLPLVLYFIRCTPAASTGFSPFLMTHGWEPRTPLQVLYQSWAKKELQNMDLTDWIEENQERLENIKNKAMINQTEVTKKRQET